MSDTREAARAAIDAVARLRKYYDSHDVPAFGIEHRMKVYAASTALEAALEAEESIPFPVGSEVAFDESDATVVAAHEGYRMVVDGEGYVFAVETQDLTELTPFPPTPLSVEEWTENWSKEHQPVGVPVEFEQYHRDLKAAIAAGEVSDDE